jgi:hypothetical protein
LKVKVKVKVKVKFILEQVMKAQGYSSTPSLTSALDGVGGQSYSPANFPRGERTCTHRTEGW